VVTQQVEVAVVGGAGDALALGQGVRQAVLGHRSEHGCEALVVLEVGVEQDPGDLGQEQNLVVGRVGDRLLVVTQPAPGLRVGVRHHGVEELDEGVDGPREAIDPERQQCRVAALGAGLGERLGGRPPGPAGKKGDPLAGQRAQVP